MKFWTVLALVLLAGCLESTPETGASDNAEQNPDNKPTQTPRAPESTPEPQPAPTTPEPSTEREEFEYTYSGRFYLHADGDALWTDRSANGSTNDVAGQASLLGDTWYTFAHGEWFPVDVVFPTNEARLKLHYSHQGSLVGTTNPEARLTIGSIAIEATQDDGWLVFALPEGAEAGSTMSLDVCICSSGPATYTGYILHTDGRSWLDI